MNNKKLTKSSDEEREEGKIKGRVIVEILGKPKEHVEKTLHLVVDRIKEQKNMKVYEERFYDVYEKGALFTGFVELDMSFNDMSSIIGFCFDFMPSSIEIIEPEQLYANSIDFAGVVNDLLKKLHDINIVVANKNIEITMLRKNLVNMIRNAVTILLSMKELNLEQLSKSTGVDEKELKPILDSFVRDNIIAIRENQNYYLPN